MFVLIFGQVLSTAELQMARYHWIYCINSDLYLYLQKVWKPLKLFPEYVEGCQCLLQNQPSFPTRPFGIFLYVSWSEETSRSRAESLSPVKLWKFSSEETQSHRRKVHPNFTLI